MVPGSPAWGRARSEREAGREQYASAILDEEYARQSIAALVAKSWLLAIEASLQRETAAEIVRSAQGATGLAQDRLRVGRGDEYDVSLAQANVETALDAERRFRLAREQALRSIETLIGRYPG